VTRLAAALCALYTLTFVWLAWSTVSTFSSAPLWSTVFNVAASLVLVIAFVQQLQLGDALRLIADLEDQARREHEARNGRPLDRQEAAAWWELAEQLTEPDDPRSAA
jgi:low affinity Fe/Cu permease